MVTIFDSLYSEKPTYANAENVLQAFKKRGKHYSTIEKIRASSKKEERDELKKTLPIICFGGKFYKRAKSGLQQSSGILTLDFDEGELDGVREKLAKWECTYSCFSSPSGGQRFKALIRIPNVKDDAEFKEFFSFFEEKYKVLDASGKDISRCCFPSYDPDTYINPNAKVFTREMLNKYRPSPPKVAADKKLLDVISGWIRYAPKGERQHQCCKAAYYAGGLTTTGQLEENKALAELEQAAHDRGGEVDQSIRAIRESFQQGKLKPIVNISELDNIAKGMSKRYVNPKSFLITQESIDEEATKYYEGGYDERIITGIEDFDYYVSFRKNSFDFMVGGSKAGKTTLKLYINTYLALKHKLKTLAICYENDAMEVQDEVIGFLTGNNASYVYRNDRKTYDRARDFFRTYFQMLKIPPDFTFINIIELAAQLNSQGEYYQLWIDPVFKIPGTEDYAGNKLIARHAEPFANEQMGLFLSMHPKGSSQREGGHVKDLDAEFGSMYGNAADITMAISREFRDPNENVRNTVNMSIDRVRSKKLKGGMETVKDCPIKWEYKWKEHNYDLWLPSPQNPDEYTRYEGGLLKRDNNSLF